MQPFGGSLIHDEDEAATTMPEYNPGSGLEYHYGSEEIEVETEPTRPNRWAGPPSTWLSITQQERDLTVSLDQLRKRDLGVHLFNAHALNQRAARLLEDKANGAKIKDPINEDADEPFLPPKLWTAWPLPPDEVPREEEQIGGEELNDVYTFKKRETEHPSRELEDMLTGVALKLAKERFQGREWPGEDKTSIGNISEDEQENEQHFKGDKGKGNLQKSSDQEEGSLDRHSSRVSKIADKKKRSKSASASLEVALGPTVSADDERSAELLRPAVRHTLSKLDDLLMILHHTRKICRQYSSQSDEDTEDEGTSVAATENPITTAKRFPGRPRKFESLADGNPPRRLPQRETTDGVETLRSRKGGRGRKPKQYPRIRGETEDEYHIRVARLQKKPLPPFTPARTAASALKNLESIGTSPKDSTVPRANITSTEEAFINNQRRLGLRDWSEILGSAALAGFPPEIIDRTTKRCANLFDEGMMMRTIVESPFGSRNTGISVAYQPKDASDLGPNRRVASVMSDAQAQGADDDSYEKQLKSFRQLDSFQSSFCPIKNCRRQKRGFASDMLLRLHLRKQHQMTKEQIAETHMRSDEEMFGAVHVDGFLRPETRQLRGKDKKQRKSRKSQLLASEDEEDDIDTKFEVIGGSEDE